MSLPQLGIIRFLNVCMTAALPLTFLTCVSSVAWQAEAEEWINLVNASSSIFTRLGLAVVDVCVEGRKKKQQEQTRFRFH